MAPMTDSRLVQFKLMLPADLKARLEELASKSHRSLSQQIVTQLYLSFELADLEKKLDHRMDKLRMEMEIQTRRVGLLEGRVERIDTDNR